MPAVPPALRPPGAANRTYMRSYATAAESDALAKLLGAGPSPFVKGYTGSPITMNEVSNPRMARATVQGMLNQALKDRGLQNVPIRIENPKEGDDRSFFYTGGDTKNPKQDYGIVIRPNYLGNPRGLDATVRHEAAHAADALTPQKLPTLAHGPSFRVEEGRQYVDPLSLLPVYGGKDYAGKDEYADRYDETGKDYQPHVYLSNYDDARVQPFRVPFNPDDMKKAIAANRKAYVANLKNPPVRKLRVGPAVRGL